MHRAPALVLLSGGVDSSACAHFLKTNGYGVQAVFIDYGQGPARREQDAAKALANHLDIPLRCIKIENAGTRGAGEVTGRNAFLIFAAIVLTPWTAGLLALGIHSGTRYYDCSNAFLSNAAALIAEHTDGRLALSIPFIDWDKAQVFDYFRSAGLPLTLTYSCEASDEHPCGTCASCRDRRALGC